MKSFLSAAYMATSTMFTLPARAHHGPEFFLLYDAHVQKPLHGMLQGQFSFLDEGTDDSPGLSPSLSLGILPRTAFNLRADFTEEAGDNWAYRSLEPGFPAGGFYPVSNYSVLHRLAESRQAKNGFPF